MELVDSHCHIQEISGEGAIAERWQKDGALGTEEVIVGAAKAGVKRLICVGTKLPDSRLAADFAAAHQNCWAAVGIHPHEAKDLAGPEGSVWVGELRTLAIQPKVIAIGECGLDYFYQHSPPAAQEKILRAQIELALACNLPLIFHVREAFQDFWPIFDSYKNLRGVVHSFSAGPSDLDGILMRGLFVGLNGIVTFMSSESQIEAIKKVPLAKMLLETDAPYLAPVPHRGAVNQPKYVADTASFLANLRGESLAAVATATTANARALFGI